MAPDEWLYVLAAARLAPERERGKVAAVSQANAPNVTASGGGSVVTSSGFSHSTLSLILLLDPSEILQADSVSFVTGEGVV